MQKCDAGFNACLRVKLGLISMAHETLHVMLARRLQEGRPMSRLNPLAMAILLASVSAQAQDTASTILPGVEPEIILTCLINDRPDFGCGFGCANTIGVLGKTSTSGFAIQHGSRVEMYLKSAPGRQDKHIWVAYLYKPFLDASSKEQTGFALVASTFTCQWGSVSGANNYTAKWRIDRFNQ